DLGKGETSQYLLTEEATKASAIGSVDDPAIIRVADINGFVRHGVRTFTVISISTARIVQLPVLFYPGLLDVHVDSHPVTYGSVGRYAAVSLPAGQHQITVQFVGVRWANVISALAWIAVVAIMFAALFTRALRTVRSEHPNRHVRRATAPAIAIAATAIVLLPGLVLVHGRRSAIDAEHRTQLAQEVNTVSSQETGASPASFSLNVTFNRGYSNPTEPLITSGKANAGDFVYVRYLPGDKIVIASDHWGSKPTESEPITVLSGQIYHIDVVLDRLNSVVVINVDGNRVLRLATPVYQAKFSEITFGENLIGGTVTSGRFSGNVSVVHRGVMF
ncbi:MAG: hypothetical protein M3008_07040, partial [Chloroflexota bacterium]|nr:hypothetical protein [Chloroflexota bacterium]